MNRLALLLPVVLLAAPAHAAQRHYVVAAFDRVRIDGPFAVRLTTRKAPGAEAEGSPRAVDGLSIRVEGTTLIVSAGPNGWSDVPVKGTIEAPVVRLTAPSVRGATVIGGGSLAIDGIVSGQRIDLNVTGSGTLAIPALETDQLNATLLGSGSMTLGGRGGRVHLLASGSGVLDAGALRGDDLVARLDGTGSIAATARYTADATSSGVGAVTIYGKPACKVKAMVGGPISCGTGAAAPIK